MKTYFFIIPSRGRINTILRSNVFVLLSSRAESRMVVFSPFSSEKSFCKEFGAPNIVHVPLEKVRFSFFVRYMFRVRENVFKVDNAITKESTLIIRSAQERRVVTRVSAREHIFIYVRILLRPFRAFLIHTFDALEFLLLHSDAYADACLRHKPHAIVLGTLGIVSEDLVWLVHARRYSIPAVAVDLPWNYFEDRIFSLPRRAHICVWGEAMARRAANEFQVPQMYIHKTGCIRYDMYAGKFSPLSRDEFARRSGVDLTRPLVTFFLGSAPWHTTQPEVVRCILRAIGAGHIFGNPQLLVRFGPSEKPDTLWEELIREYPDNLIFSSHERAPNQEDVANIIYHSAVTLSIFSSLALDAAVLDRPAFFVGFSGHEEKQPIDAVIARIFDFNFVRQALNMGGVHVAYNARELASFIQESIEHPEKYREGRKELVRHFLGVMDGKAGERIAEVVSRVSFAA